MAYASNLSYSRSGGMHVEASPGKYFMRPFLENTQHKRKKRVSRVAQVFE
jgi:hypothetical protein